MCYCLSGQIKWRQQLQYLGVDLIKQGEQKRVEVSEEKGKDASELPFEGDPRMVVLQLSNGLKQRWTHQAQKRHDNLHLKKRSKLFISFFKKIFIIFT